MKAHENSPLTPAEQRKKQGLSLSQVSEATKIAVRYLTAIETGNFERLPGGVYSSSYIRQYAQMVGFDAGELLEQYREATAPKEDPSRARPADAPPPGRFLDSLAAWLGPRWLVAVVRASPRRD